MTAILPFLPRYWPARNLTATWLRLGKIAVISVLAALSLAGMMAFAGNQAEAQGSQGGYTYTQRVCQEYGQQPRHYNVRDPIPGSDWRSDGGWAIVLVRSARTVTSYSLNADGYFAPVNIGNYHIDDPANGVEKRRLTDRWNGRSAFVRYDRSVGRFRPREIIFDANDDGELTSADIVPHASNPALMFYRTGRASWWTEAYGASYIRWANMAWCR